MPHNKLPRVIKHYSLTGRRKPGRPLKRLPDTWDRNGSTIGPTPWPIYNNDDITFPHSSWISKANKYLLKLCGKKLLF